MSRNKRCRVCGTKGCDGSCEEKRGRFMKAIRKTIGHRRRMTAANGAMDDEDISATMATKGRNGN